MSIVNSDPVLLAVFLRFLATLGLERSTLTYRVSIHESADADAAVRWWSEALALPLDRFQPASLKRHSMRTNRRNTGAGYHGCLTIDVPQGREIYWMIEGVIEESWDAAARELRRQLR